MMSEHELTCWAMPECETCGLRKKPYGRSAPLEAANVATLRRPRHDHREPGAKRGRTEKLTPEQLENWRTAMTSMFGPYALIMSEAQIQRLRDKLQEWCDTEARP